MAHRVFATERLARFEVTDEGPASSFTGLHDPCTFDGPGYPVGAIFSVPYSEKDPRSGLVRRA